jgi:hypothetical protein
MELEQLIIKGNQKNNMAKKISTKVNYQVTELVNNLNEAATTQSEQKRDFFTTRALYNAKRLSTILSSAKVGAMALVLTIGMVACGAPASSEVKADSTATDSTKVDTAVVAPVADTTSVVK